MSVRRKGLLWYVLISFIYHFIFSNDKFTQYHLQPVVLLLGCLRLKGQWADLTDRNESRESGAPSLSAP